MAEAQILNPGCADDDDDDHCEQGKRGKRGKRGHRGHRGSEGSTGSAGPTGSTGPTGPTGGTGPTGPSSPVTHVEAKLASLIPLPPNTLTTVLTCPPILTPIGSIVEISGMINYSNSDNTTGSTAIAAGVYQDGVFQGGAVVTPGVIPGAGVFDMAAALPIIWFLAGDGLSHVYTVQVQTNATSDGFQAAGAGAIFVNVIGP